MYRGYDTRLLCVLVLGIAVVGGLWGRGSKDTGDTLPAGEGVLTVAAESTELDSVLDSFRTRSGVALTTTRLSRRLLLEQPGTGGADVIQGTAFLLDALQRRGDLASYRSPEAQNYPAWAVKDTFCIFALDCVGILFISADARRAPASYHDLTDPRWKGNILMPNPRTNGDIMAWLVGLKEQRVFPTETAWRAFLAALAANEPRFTPSFGVTPLRLRTGDAVIAVSLLRYLVTGATGASELLARRPLPPLGWRPMTPLLGIPQAIGITAQAAHPHAAQSFVDYWLSGAGAALIAGKIGLCGLVPGIVPPLPEIDTVTILPLRELSPTEQAHWGAEFGRIFRIP